MHLVVGVAGSRKVSGSVYCTSPPRKQGYILCLAYALGWYVIFCPPPKCIWRAMETGRNPMLPLFDRSLIVSYVKSYLICLISLLGLYVIVDLFNHIDDFAAIKGGFLETVKHIGYVYGCQITYIFDRLSDVIVLLAAMFTIAWVQRSNELLPMLSAGVSTRRVIRPILMSACGFVFINIANQELLIPSIGDISISRSDPNQSKEIQIRGAFDANRILISGSVGYRNELKVLNFVCNIPPELGRGQQVTLQAEKAVYVPPGAGIHSGGWLLYETKPKELNNWNRNDVLSPLDTGKYFLDTNVDFDRLTRPNNYYQFLSTWQLYLELDKAESHLLTQIAVFFHMRLTRPLLGIILVTMGLGVILRDHNRHIFISIGACLLLCALFFGILIGSSYLGNREMLSPALAAWLPVFIFGPVAGVLFDAVHT